MRRGLVLSLFPGIDLLGRAFEAEGWCVVWGPDLIYARDIRGWHAPRGRFDAIIAGPPCQSFSPLANLVRARGREPKYGDMHPEFGRVVAEAAPTWWLCENSDRAYPPEVPGYVTESFFLSPRHLGDPQSRRRRFTVGGVRQPNIERRLPRVALEPAEFYYTVTKDTRQIPVARGGSGKRKSTRMGHDRVGPVVTPQEMAARQGFPELDLTECGWTVNGMRAAIGNGVPRVMGEALARAIGEWQEELAGEERAR